MDLPFPLHTAFLLFYLLALIAVGAVKAARVRSQTDFSLAGRGLPTFVLAGTLLATWIGTGSIFGNAEESYAVGVPAFLLPVSGGVGIIVLYFLAARIRRFGQFTIQDILEARFGVATRVIGTVTLLLAYVIIVSYQYRAGAAILERLVPGLEHHVAVLSVAVFVILYTALAGMFSVAYTDVANGILMTVGIFVALPILLAKGGGISGVVSSLDPPQRSLFGHYSAAHLLSVLLPSLLLIIGDANMYQRFFSAKDPGAARRSAAWMFAGVLVLECGIIGTALAAKALVAQGSLPAPDNAAHIVVQAAFLALPPLLGTLLVATVVAVIVSTADSYLLAPATSLVRDVYQRFIAGEAAPGRRIVGLGRAVVVLLGAAALLLSFTSDEFFRVALFAYTIYGAGITPVLLAAFFWPRATPAGAVAAMVSGVLSAVGWQWLIAGGALADWAHASHMEGLASLTESLSAARVEAIIPSLVVSLAVLVAVSLGTRRPDSRAGGVL